jgi:hypothetical protein
VIKKSIASILIVLIFINSVGCMSYNQLGINDKNKIEEAEEIILTTVDNKKYILTNVVVQDSVLSGDQWVENNMRKISREFSAEQILSIEAEEVDADSVIWLVIGTVGLLALFGLNNALADN